MVMMFAPSLAPPERDNYYQHPVNKRNTNRTLPRRILLWCPLIPGRSAARPVIFPSGRRKRSHFSIDRERISHFALVSGEEFIPSLAPKRKQSHNESGPELKQIFRSSGIYGLNAGAFLDRAYDPAQAVHRQLPIAFAPCARERCQAPQKIRESASGPLNRHDVISSGVDRRPFCQTLFIEREGPMLSHTRICPQQEPGVELADFL